jgi:hypothetical protein
VRLQAALRACTAYPTITGWYRRKDVEPSEQERSTPTVADLDHWGHVYGLASVPGYPSLPCGCLAIRYDAWNIDWLHVYIPLAAISSVEDRVGAFPFGDDGGAVSLIWRAPFDAWFTGLAEFINGVIPFGLALVGFEVPDWRLADAIHATSVPEERDCVWLVPLEGELRSYPATF